MHSTKQHVTKSLASLATFRNIALMAALLAVATALILISTTTQAQASNGAVPNLQLSSASPGALTITWDTPDPAPSDYRVIWAKQDLDFLSYKNSNEANRGNEYPGGDETSITLTGLTKGQTFKVKSRARYTSGGQNNGSWSGPWTGTITTRVKDDTPAAPTGLTASEVTHDSVSLSWTAPSRGTVTGYRVLRGADANSLSTMTDDTGSTSPEYTDSTVDAKTTYHYAVLAHSQDGNGVQSTTVSTTTPAEPRQQQENTNSFPTASNGTVATDEDTDHAFSASEFNYSDSDSDTLASVKITELPAADRGTLTLDGTAINSADLPKTITKAELDDGKLKYSPPADANGTGYASFRFRVNDGTQDSASQYTLTISVTAVNDPATGAPAISGAAEVGETLTTTSSIADPDGLPSSFTHQWKRFAADGTTFEANIGTDSGTYTLTDSELGKKVKVEVSFTDNEGSSEGPLASAAYPSDATVEAPEEEVSSPGISIVVEAPSKTTVGSAGTVSADIVGFDVFPDPDGHEYTYRIDVLDSDGGDVDGCEGDGMGEALRIFKNKTAWIFVRPGATELREAQISDQCETGAYTARGSVSDEDSTLVVSGEAEFEIVAQPPAAPTGLTTQGVTHNSITLSWTDPEDASITGYRVLRGNEASKLTAIADDTDSDSVEYTDSTVAAEIAYFYAVLALSQDGDGAQSAALSVTTPAEPSENKDDPKPTAVPNRVTRADPTVPLNLAVVPADAQLTFTWDPPTNTGGSPIIRYNYEFGPSGGTQADGNHGTDPTGSQTLTKTGLTNGTAYTFKVRAITNFGGNTTVGPYTAVVTGTPNGPITLVSNASEALTGGGSTHFLAQSFGTGSHSTGYTVSEVQIYLTTVSGKSTNVRIKEDNSGAPGDEVALLMNPGTFTANAFNTFTAPADTVLRGSRTYWLSVNEGISSASRMSYGSTRGTGQTGATGWTIADGRRYRNSEAASWTTDSVSLRITVKGTANPPDTTAPAFASAAADGTSLIITFDEDLAAAASLANSAFTVKKTPTGGSEATVTLSATAPVISGKTVTLTLATALVSTDGSVKVTYTKPTSGSNNKLVDATGNETATFTDQPVTNNTPATDTTTFISNTGQTDSITGGLVSNTKYFAQQFMTGSNTGGYSLSAIVVEIHTGSAATPAFALHQSTTVSGVEVPGTKVVNLTGSITTAGEQSFTPDTTTTLSASTKYFVVLHTVSSSVLLQRTNSDDEDSGGSTGWEIADNYVVSLNSGSTWLTSLESVEIAVKGTAVVVTDTTAPAFASAAANGASLVITFDEDLAAAASLANGAFTVKKTPTGGSEATTTLSTTTGPVISGKTVTLTLATALVSTDTAVKVSYTKPTTGSNNKLVDAAANETADFTDQTVTNNTPAAQTVTTFISNTGQTDVRTGVSRVVDFSYAQQFTTGGNPGGYTLSAVVVDIRTGSSTATQTSALHQSTTVGGVEVPGTKVVNLSGSVATAGEQSFTPASATTLSASTKYFVVLSINGSILIIHHTISDDEDSGGSTGWEIANNSLRAANPVSTWTSFSNKLEIAVKGTAVPDTTAPAFESAAANGTSLVITFDEDLAAAASLANSAFTVKKTPSGATEATVTLSTTTGPVISGKTVTLTLATALVSTDGSVKVTYTKPATGSNNKLVDAAANETADFTDQPVTNNTPATDTTAPAFESAAASGPSLVITFDEDLAAAANLANGAFTVKKTPSGGSEATVTLSATAPVISGKTVTLTLATALVSTDGSVKVSYTKPTTGSNNKLVDAAANATADFTDQPVTNNTVLAPRVASIVRQNPTSSPTNADSLTWRVTFSTRMRNVDATDFSVDGTTATLTVQTFSGVTGAYNVKASGGNLASLNATVTLSFSETHNIQDAFNDALTNTTPTGTNDNTFVVDNAGPTLSSATVSAAGTFIQLNFSENVDRTNRPPASAFPVTADGIGVTVSAVSSAAALDELRVTPSPVIRAGQVVVISYTDPTTSDDANAIQDTLGNDAASFTTGSNSVPAVTNSSTTAAVVPGAPTGLSVTENGATAVDLSWTAPADNGGRIISGYKIEWSAAGSAPWTAVVATTGSAATTYSNTGLTAGTTHHYRVFAINSVGTGAVSNTATRSVPAITAANAFRVPGVLTANKGNIADTDGVPNESTFSWQWVRVDGTNETDITGATAASYTLTAADAGKTIKVKASFTDNAGNREGPFTSEATSTILAAATCAVPTSYPGGATQLWTGKVTVGQIHFGATPGAVRGFSSANIDFGFGNLLAQNAAGALSNTMFNAGSQYTVKLAGVSARISPLGTGRLYFATTSAIPAAVRTQLTLYACDQAFPFSTGSALGQATYWTSPVLDWTDKVDRTLYISRDQTAPTASSVSFTGTTLTLTFNEDLGGAASLANSAFTVKKTTSGGVETTVTLSGTPTISGKTVVLTLGAAPGATDTITVTYTKPTTGTSNKLVDKFSNEAATFTKSVADTPVADTSAPAFASATADGTSLVITFDENLAAAASLANSAFTVKKTPSGATEATVTLSTTVGPVISGKTVTLTLATALVSTDGSVKVTYTKPTTGTANKLVDAAANETGTFTDRTVTNNTPASNSAATGAPAITPANAFRVPGVLTANKGSIADTNGLPEESTFTWQWVQVDGMTETDIVSATSQTYTLVAADAGKTIKVKASFTDTASNSEGPLTSAATSTILAAATCAVPTSYPGGATQIWTGKVTVGQVKVGNDPLSIRGYLSQSTNFGIVIIPATDAAGTLSNTAFAAGSQYTIKLAGTQIANNTLFFATTPAMTAADRKQLTLYVCDEAFPFSEARQSNDPWFWNNSGVDWRDKVERTLYITRDQTAPTVTSVAFTGTTLTLTFDEDLGPAASLANSAFTVKKTRRAAWRRRSR